MNEHKKIIQLEKNSEEGLFLELKDLTFIPYNGITFEKFNWRIKNKENWAIVGPAGSGKTTLAEAITGKYFIRQGSINYYFSEDCPLSEKTEESFFLPLDFISFLSFQEKSGKLDYSNFFYQQRYHTSLSEGILTVASYLTQSSLTADEEINREEIFSLLRIDELLSLEFIKLSNGQTRRVRLAKALLRNPKLLILDNPFIGLDTSTRKSIAGIIDNLILKGTRIILITTPSQIPEQITNVLVLENFCVKGTFTRDEFRESFNKETSLPSLHSTAPKQLSFLEKPDPGFTVAFACKNVTVQYGEKKVLENINWTVKKGEKWALVGPNGSGKSTLLSLINGDNPQAYANDITLFDRRRGSGESIWEIKKRIGFLSPELHLYFRKNMMAEEVAATGFFDTLSLSKELSDKEENTVIQLFDFYKLGHLRKRNFPDLSTGEQRIVLLIRSLVKVPDVIIWDEPFQGLNEELIRLSKSLLDEYCQVNQTLLFVSHYLDEIPTCVTNYLYLENGKVAKMN